MLISVWIFFFQLTLNEVEDIVSLAAVDIEVTVE